MAARSNSSASCGTVACSWLERSTIPGTSPRTSSAADARRRSTDRSGPKIFTARLALEPEIMWSMRWLMGWPKVTLTPGIVATARRISTSRSSFGRPFRSTTSISAPLTPCRCSSRSARPVRRLVDTTSGKGQQRLFDLPAEGVALGEGDSRRRSHGHRQRALVERGHEASSRADGTSAREPTSAATEPVTTKPE